MRAAMASSRLMATLGSDAGTDSWCDGSTSPAARSRRSMRLTVSCAQNGRSTVLAGPAAGKVNRSEFGVAACVPAASDEVEIRIEIEAHVVPKG
jgi:hypothetical protein